jgi:thiol-disulfide isomerase/thioredoxin
MNVLALSLLAALSLQPVLNAHDWLNSQPQTKSVAGKVVVLDVFTVDCYNCKNVIPALRDLYRTKRAQGLEIIGIHSPETPIEKQRSHVVENLVSQGIQWPVALDNGFSLWDTYQVNAWPTQLFFDRHGRLRKVIVGDSQDDAVRAEVEALLAEK